MNDMEGRSIFDSTKEDGINIMSGPKEDINWENEKKSA